MFEPSSSVYIGAVPWNPDYRHVRLFGSRAEQEAYMLGKCPNELRRSDYTYQRQDNSIVVPFNAEQLYGYNYCMFKNSNYGSKWFFAFIVNTEYVNPESTRLTLSTDIMQTWFLDCEVHACYVEREHVNDDSIGAHIKDEGMSCGEMVCVDSMFDDTSLYTVVSSAAEPRTDGTYVNNGGDVYEGVTAGTALSVFDCSLPDQLAQFKLFMQSLADNGQQDAVNAVYMVPATVVPGFASKSSGYGQWVKGDNEPARSDEIAWDAGFTSLDGYVPKNNKMYCYPFEYVEAGNLAGTTQQFALEFWGTPGKCSFRRTGGVDVNASQVYIPLGYNGMDVFWEGAVSMPPYPSCSWVYQSYANWLGATKYEVKLAENVPFVGDVTTQGDWYTQQEMGNIYGFLSGARPGNVGSSLAGLAMNQYNALASLSQRQRTPNTSRGGTNSSVTLANLSLIHI